jgi:reverse gyrase
MDNLNIKIKYLKICPIDKNQASAEEIIKFGECYDDYQKFKKNYQDLLINEDCDDLKESQLFCEIEKKIKLFKNYFQQLTGYQPYSLQIYWAKKILKNESLSILAPTGFGKSTFGIIFSLFAVTYLKEKKIYYLVPTKILVNEIEKKFNMFNKNGEVKILTIKNTKDKDKLNEDYDILISTSQFLHKNFDILPKTFNLIYIDDSDSLIRQPKNIDKILNLIGFDQNDLEIGLKIINTKRKQDFQEITNLKEKINFKNKGRVIVSSATLTIRSKRINLFKELLNFEIGNSNTYLRNINDFYEITKKNNDLFIKSIQWIKKLGKGGFIFLSDRFSKEELNNYVQFLNNNHIPSIAYDKFNKKNRELFESGKIAVVVGFSNIRNPLTRGIDLPHVVRYSLFLGVPRFKLPFKISYSPRGLLMIILTLQSYFKEDKDILNDIKFLKKYSFLKEDNIIANQFLKAKIEKIQLKINYLLNNQTIFQQIENNPNLNIIKEEDNLFLLIPDAKGYLQASGRTSRLFPLGLTKGLSLILIDDVKLFNNLKRKLKILGYQIDFLSVSKNSKIIKETLIEVNQDRKLVKDLLKGEQLLQQDPVRTALIIVESPTKAKTIANFFGKPSKKVYENFWVYEVSLGNYLINIMATLGHFVDLIYNKGFYGVEIDNNNNFIPVFEPLKICLTCSRHIDIDENQCAICLNNKFFNKEKLIDVLRNLAHNVEEVYLTTDPDTEGEKIAFDLFIYLYPYNKNIKRIELHEITKEEFLKRFNNPRTININLVSAQITRRIADRWVGFYLSQDIQKEFRNLNLSAGRVQTPVLGWIIKNDLDRKKNKIYQLRIFFNKDYYFDFQVEDKEIIKKIKKNINNLFLEIQSLNEKEETINPLPPFQTSELLKASWNFLKFDLETTMSLAQNLFERGLITYHRTDSFYVSEFGRNVAYEFLEKNNKKNLIYKRAWGEIGTHECIRPTKALSVEEIIEQAIINQTEILSSKHLKLYNLILRRFIASQCQPSKVKKNIIKLKLMNDKEEIFLKDQREIITHILENGFNDIYYVFSPLSLDFKKFQVNQINIVRYSKSFPYTNASIIDEMKNKNLGRPSTYSSIINTLLERKYVLIKKGYLIPTNQGKKIYEFLSQKYPDLISEEFTKKLEEDMDKIEKRKINYQEILKSLLGRINSN